MADVRSFRGIHYNKTLLKDWEKVLSPVYDIISPQQQEELYKKSEYNFVRIELTRESPGENKYTSAARTLEQWLKQGILEIDREPAIYLYDQFFTYGGLDYKRRGIIVRVRLEEWDKMIIRPHEYTMAAPKADRITLL